jgi:hypothetical protein
MQTKIRTYVITPNANICFPIRMFLMLKTSMNISIYPYLDQQRVEKLTLNP